ncbi:putative FAD dependent oxidoreductase [Actinacidiphila reveromycinica]|uniref:Putative FAD dependent oxidoreductase n=1 Tax=Actinacidiphila reveromycinica TaxID=659352 RepID=G1UDU6_9ACTN|nr:NAD(P)/FAD-dependent oxidoreductase [Streptomyces sp. SN-593]BAK64642.1 putative FAD dependent oxidoreductase [Streptomyces sp. SN-593]BBB01299.1 putative FAD dependent oxidoreductase [Streptomyces sp. SN-593]
MAEHVDVLVVGAGLSGIGAAGRLRRADPRRTLAILEARDAVGGTWDLFRYPGVRSDSDMHTLGYQQRPWKDPKAIADGESILSYIRETAREDGLLDHVRFRHRVVGADWDEAHARWNVRVERGAEGEAEEITLTCSFLYLCSGYYRYDEGYSPQFKDADRFGGRIVHPQHWPADLDYTGKRVVVIGSGATAVTLVPAMAARAAHVTMLQRSPSYVMSLPSRDGIAGALRRVLPERTALAAIRWKNATLALGFYRFSRKRPEKVKAMLRKGVVKQLPDGYDVDTHFTPRYAPWDQRVCYVPDGDLFKAISAGEASVVTDHVESFTERGLLLRSGKEVPADVVVTATGLNLLPLGGIRLSVAGRPVDPGATVAYKGMMLSGVPNFAWTLGYTNSSWTLKADLVAQYVSRLLAHMAERGHAVVRPLAPPAGDEVLPILDLRSGYVLRGADTMPKRGTRAPWTLEQNYRQDVRLLWRGPVDDAVEFAPAPSGARAAGSGDAPARPVPETSS